MSSGPRRPSVRRLSLTGSLAFFLLVTLLLRFYLQGVQSVIGPAPRGLSSVVLDLNSASEDELTLLRGVGPVRARAIVANRQRHGPFGSIDDVARVAGIGPVTVEALRSQARVVASALSSTSARR